jgi:hypothetical protein
MSHPNSNSNLFSFGHMHHSLDQALADESSEGPASPAAADGYSTPQEHASPTRNPRPSEATPSRPARHADKDSPPAHTPLPSQDHGTPNDTTHSLDEIHELLLQMGAVQTTMREGIEGLVSFSARALQGSTEHTTQLAANTPALLDTTRALEAQTATARPAATPSKRIAPPNHTDPDTASLAAQDVESDSVRVRRLEASNAVLERANAALEEEVEGLRRQNRGLRREWRRNVMMQGLRWVGRDTP